MSNATSVPTAVTPMRSPEYLIEDILPSKEVHLIGGPSGAGKTTWLFQMLKEQWRLGGTILGKGVFPVPFVYISADRSNAGVRRTMHRAGVNPDTVSFMSLMNFPDVKTVPQAIDKILLVKPDAKLFFIDGVMGLLPPRRDSNSDGGFLHISKFLSELCRLCVSKDITVVLIVHSPKQKEDSRYSNPRERVMGSAAWAAFSETVILVEPLQPVSKETSHCRTLICLPRNSAAIFVDLEFNGRGRLVERNEDLGDFLVEQWLAEHPTFSTAQFEQGTSAFFSKSSATRWLKRALENNVVHKERHGMYSYIQVRPPRTDPPTVEV